MIHNESTERFLEAYHQHFDRYGQQTQLEVLKMMISAGFLQVVGAPGLFVEDDAKREFMQTTAHKATQAIMDGWTFLGTSRTPKGKLQYHFTRPLPVEQNRDESFETLNALKYEHSHGECTCTEGVAECICDEPPHVGESHDEKCCIHNALRDAEG